jgi:hypothetical protein
MDESSWLGSIEPGELMDFLDFNSPSRKKRLFGVAACYRVLDWLVERRWQRALQLYEKEVDSASYFMDNRELGLAVAELTFQLWRVTTQPAPPHLVALEALSALTTGYCRRAAFLAWQAYTRHRGGGDAVAIDEATVQSDLPRCWEDGTWRIHHRLALRWSVSHHVRKHKSPGYSWALCLGSAHAASMHSGPSFFGELTVRLTSVTCVDTAEYGASIAASRFAGVSGLSHSA